MITWSGPFELVFVLVLGRVVEAEAILVGEKVVGGLVVDGGLGRGDVALVGWEEGGLSGGGGSRLWWFWPFGKDRQEFRTSGGGAREGEVDSLR